MLVRPGRRISANNRLPAAAKSIRPPVITRPLPVDKSIGDPGVRRHCQQHRRALRIQVDRLAQDSVVARIATLVS